MVPLKVKGKGLFVTCSAGSEWEYRYSSAHVQLQRCMGLGGQLHTLATLLPYSLYMRLGGAVAGVDGCGEENLPHGISLKLDTGSTDRHSFMPLCMGFTMQIVRKLTTQNMGISCTEF